MRKSTSFIILSISFVANSFLFMNCGRPRKLPEQDSILSQGIPTYSMLNENIFTAKCASCHNSFTTYSGLMASGYVVAGNPEQSLIYLRTASGQMPKGQTPLSDNEVKAIYNWISAGAKASGDPTNPLPTPTPPVNGGGGGGGSPPPSNDISPTYAWIQANVFTPRCVVCHQGTNAPAGYDLSSYSGVTSGGRVVANNPFSSTLFNRINNNSMPPGGPALSGEIKKAVETWIANGAKDDAPAGGVPPGATPPPLPPLEAKFSSIQANILNPRCIACHNPSNASKGVDLTTYARVMREVVVRNAKDSELYDVLADNKMPRSGSPLSFEQKEVVRQWINNGAPNN